MKIKIEKGVAPPQQTKRIGLQKSMPLDEMEVGDSFFVQGRKKSTVYQMVIIWEKTKNRHCEFLFAEVENGVRVWRIS